MRIWIKAFFLVLFFGSAVSTPLLAQNYRKNRQHQGFEKKKEIKIEKKESKQTVLSGRKKRSPLKLQAFERFTQERMQERTTEQINTLLKLIESSDESEKARYLFLLAEHYWENSKYYDFIGHRYDDFRGKPNWAQKKELQEKAWADSKAYRKKAVEQYLTIIKKYPKFDKLCQVYYFLGKNVYALGQQQEALTKVYKPMLTRFYDRNDPAGSAKACPYIPNVFLTFGEFNFNKGDVPKALNAYLYITKNFPKSSIYGFTLYKIAWCYYNLIQYGKALQTFEALIRHARYQKTSTGSRNFALLKEALRDYVVTFSQSEDAKTAEERFLRVGGDELMPQMLENLGSMYRDQGKMASVIYLYSLLLRKFPNQPKNMWYQLYILRAVYGIRSKEEAIRETWKLVTLTQYYQKQDNAEQKHKEVFAEIADQLKEYATHLLYEAQKTLQTSIYKQSGEFFKAYLALFSGRKDAQEMLFFSGEIDYKLGDYEKAAESYEKALKAEPKGKYAEIASYNIVLSLNEQMRKKRIRIKAVTGKKDIIQRPLDPLTKRFLVACEVYLKNFPNNKNSIDISYKAALAYYYFNHFEEALPRFYFLVKKHPKHNYSMFSAHYILDTYALQQKWSLLNKESWSFYRNEQLGNKEFKKEIREIIMKSGFKTCVAIEKKQKQYKEAGDCFMKIVQEFPDNPKLGILAMNNAALNFNKGKQSEKALEISNQLIQKYSKSKSKYVKNTMLRVASIYAQRAHFELAAQNYEAYANKYAKELERNKLLRLVGLYNELLGKDSKAITLYQRIIQSKAFQKQAKKDPKVQKNYVQLYFQIAKLKKKQSSRTYSKMMQDFDKKRMGNPSERLFAKMEVALVLKQNGQKKKAEKMFEQIIREYAKLPAVHKIPASLASAAVAQAAFWIAERAFWEYKKLTVKKGQSQKQLQAQMKKKEKAMVDAFKMYKKVILYKQGHWGVAALYQSGLIFENFGLFYKKIPAPNYKKSLQQILYKRVYNQIRKKIKRRPPASVVNRFVKKLLPQFVEKKKEEFENLKLEKVNEYEQSAVKEFERCLQFAHRLNVYNSWTNKALQRLKALNPMKYSNTLEFLPTQKTKTEPDFSFSNELLTSTP